MRFLENKILLNIFSLIIVLVGVYFVFFGSAVNKAQAYSGSFVFSTCGYYGSCAYYTIYYDVYTNDSVNDPGFIVSLWSYSNNPPILFKQYCGGSDYTYIGMSPNSAIAAPCNNSFILMNNIWYGSSQNSGWMGPPDRPYVNYYCNSDSDGYVSSAVSGSCNTYNCIPSGCSRSAGNDCNDSNASIYPGAPEVCGGTDWNCDGRVDADCDGFLNNNDCNDHNAGVYPGATETCNGIDDNCDGRIDDGIPSRTCYDGAATTKDVGICKGGIQTCVPGGTGTWGSCVGQVLPGKERINLLDDNCNGLVDEGLDVPDIPPSDSTAKCDYTYSGTTSGLVSWWRFDETSGTSLADQTGLISGTVNGSNSSIIDGRFQKARNFTPTDYASFVSSSMFDFGKQMTISVWANLKASSATLFTRSSSYALTVNSGNSICFNTYDGTSWDNYCVTNPGSIYGAWHNYAITYDGTNKKIFVDGSEIGSKAYDKNIYANPWGGENVASSVTSGSIDIDDVRAYSRPLNLEEINGVADFICSGSGGAIGLPDVLNTNPDFSSLSSDLSINGKVEAKKICLKNGSCLSATNSAGTAIFYLRSINKEDLTSGCPASWTSLLGEPEVGDLYKGIESYQVSWGTNYPEEYYRICAKDWTRIFTTTSSTATPPNCPYSWTSVATSKFYGGSERVCARE